MLYLCFFMRPFKGVSIFNKAIKLFFDPFLLMLHPDSSFFSALPSWSVFPKRPVAPLPASFRYHLSLFSTSSLSHLHLYLPYPFMSGLFNHHPFFLVSRSAGHNVKPSFTRCSWRDLRLLTRLYFSLPPSVKFYLFAPLFFPKIFSFLSMLLFSPTSCCQGIALFHHSSLLNHDLVIELMALTQPILIKKAPWSFPIAYVVE